MTKNEKLLLKALEFIKMGDPGCWCGWCIGHKDDRESCKKIHKLIRKIKKEKTWIPQ